MKKTTLLLLFILLSATLSAQKVLYTGRYIHSTPCRGKTFPYIRGELGNSSAACTQDIERIFPKLQRMGLNTVLVPAYWDLIEPVEGQYDFTLTDKAIEQAPGKQSENNIPVVWSMEKLHELLHTTMVQDKL